ncbi:uncharacterized protein LOC131147986 [Malania oleifera]|uniref:uncharacterized protein LOC131147986 n=1 Tax=Malania oleifera TaxID=397392 RepID=UPI0025AE55C0|nr:uncharacterized protein LOC131147986 [Malania oleifera]
MEFDIPMDLIREAQSLLRKEAGLSSYDPDDPTLPSLPSLAESISQFDPSPPHLRCKQCKGTLLGGLQSKFCLYCGAEQRKEVPPDPIAFKSTFGYRWLLETLDLDGSETVGPPVDRNELNREQSASKDELSLADFLDLEIKWTAESEKIGATVSNQASLLSQSSPNLSDDIDNFFPEPNRETAFNASEEQLVPNTLISSKESPAFQVQNSPSLFETVQPSDTAVRSSGGGNDDIDSSWEADFQSASSGTTREDSKSFDPLVGSDIDISAHMDTVFGLGKDKQGANPEDDLTPASITNDWIQDEQWNNLNCSISSQVQPFVGEFKDGGPVGKSNIPSTSDDWIQDDQWQTSSKTDNKIVIEDYDSFDAWNDFTNSTSGQDPSNSSWKQAGDDSARSDAQNANVNFCASTNNKEEMDFGSFLLPDLSLGALKSQNNSKVNNMQSEVSVSDSMDNEKIKIMGNAEVAVEGVDAFDATTQSKTDDIEVLMSQMHDLSFMLESSLSVPTKPDGFS